MCGICGIVSPSSAIEERLATMTRSLAHRGPDAEGSFIDEAQSVGLGHRRLSILDLSEAANQPFHSRDERYVIVFNGEIYNFKELQQSLPLPCRTQSDTEALLELFASMRERIGNPPPNETLERLAAPFTARLQGMYAFAIYDRNDRATFLFRDHAGIKPLFYRQEGTQLLFASEIKAIRAVSPTLKVNRRALSSVLHVGYSAGDETAYEGVYKLPIGSAACFSGGQLTVRPYYRHEEQIGPILAGSEAELKKRLKGTLREAVRLRLIADVPVGTFLSGGIDSSLVTAVACEQSVSPVKTFSIGFKNATYDESDYARRVAKKLQTDHHEYTVEHDEALAMAEGLVNLFDEPMTDASAINVQLISRFARQHVKVALSGDGGDELFLGYGMYEWAERINRPLLRGAAPLLSRTLRLSKKSRYQNAANLLDLPHRDRVRSHVFSQEQHFFSAKDLQRILVEPVEAKVREDFGPHARELTPAESQALFDLNHYLPGDLLTKVDRGSMRFGLEVRVPLLHRALIGFALNLPPELKRRNGTFKYLLREVLYDYLPRALFERPKWGFGVPIRFWLRKELRYLVDNYLSRESVEDGGLVRWPHVERMVQEYMQGRDYHFNRIWALILVHKWLHEQT